MYKKKYAIKRTHMPYKGKYWSDELEDFVCISRCSTYFKVPHVYPGEAVVEVNRTMAGRWKIMGVVKYE